MKFKLASFLKVLVFKLRQNPKKYKNILELAGVKENMKVLDYGCGIGSYSIETSKMMGNSGEIICGDISDVMIKEAKKSIEKNNIPNIKPLLVKSMNDIHDSNFDFIYLIDMLHAVPNNVEMVNFMIDKLSENGKLLVKFEHFSDEEIESLYNNSKCSYKKLLFKDYWILK